MSEQTDLFIIGGGINGCGIARDAAGRGLSVRLAEMDDLASATSGASTKLFHGGLRYLEYFELRLVREALIERENLLTAMPHIAWPMRFVIPFHNQMRFDSSTPTSRIVGLMMPWLRGRRPGWLLRLGLFLYDNLGGRKILPGTKTLDLTKSPEGGPLSDRFKKAFEYSDCWVDDARLVALNARDAKARGADILTRTKVTQAKPNGDHWQITTRNAVSGEQITYTAKMLVNAAGPWVGDVIRNRIKSESDQDVRLVRGSHIVTPKIYDHDKCYFFQGTDGRIIFSIPYEDDFTLIGTTDADHDGPETNPVCSEEEATYLLDFANQYFSKTITRDDIVWRYSGVRPLYDDGASSASAATRDYTLSVDASAGPAVLNIFGGKITTYRRLSESALEKIAPFFSGVGGRWTKKVALPGGDFAYSDKGALLEKLGADYPFLDGGWAARLFRAYGLDAWALLGTASRPDDLGKMFGATLSEAEVEWQMQNEFSKRADDVVWRRTKLGLRMTESEIAALDQWMTDRLKPKK